MNSKQKREIVRAVIKEVIKKTPAMKARDPLERILVIDSVERDLVWNFQQGNNGICAFLSGARQRDGIDRMYCFEI